MAAARRVATRVENMAYDSEMCWELNVLGTSWKDSDPEPFRTSQQVMQDSVHEKEGAKYVYAQKANSTCCNINHSIVCLNIVLVGSLIIHITTGAPVCNCLYKYLSCMHFFKYMLSIYY